MNEVSACVWALPQKCCHYWGAFWGVAEAGGAKRRPEAPLQPSRGPDIACILAARSNWLCRALIEEGWRAWHYSTPSPQSTHTPTRLSAHEKLTQGGIGLCFLLAIS